MEVQPELLRDSLLPLVLLDQLLALRIILFDSLLALVGKARSGALEHHGVIPGGTTSSITTDRSILHRAPQGLFELFAAHARNSVIQARSSRDVTGHSPTGCILAAFGLYTKRDKKCQRMLKDYLT